MLAHQRKIVDTGNEGYDTSELSFDIIFVRSVLENIRDMSETLGKLSQVRVRAENGDRERKVGD